MKRRTWSLILVGSFLVGVLTACVMTFLDWRLNPAGVFHRGGQTNWDPVLDTAFSWFLPVSLLTLVISATVGSLLAWRRKQA